MNKILIFVWPFTSFIFTTDCFSCQNAVDKNFEHALSLARQSEVKKAEEILSQSQDAEVIRMSSQFLEDNPNVEESIKSFCLIMLDKRGFGKTEAGFELFSQSIEDESFKAVAMLGIADAPAKRRNEAVSLLLDALKSAPKGVSLDGLVRRLSKWDTDSRQAVPVIEYIFRDSRQDDRTRAIAVQALLEIGPISDVVTKFVAQDAGVLLGPLSSIGAKTNGTFDGKPTSKEQIRAYVLEAVRSDDKEVRKLAFDALPMVYGKDALLGDAKDEYRFDPIFLQAIVHMAKNDPDDELRTRAQKWIDSKDQRMKNAIRRRENPEKYKIEEK